MLCALLAAIVAPLTPSHAQCVGQERVRLSAAGDSGLDHFGQSVDLDGDVAVVGAPLDDEACPGDTDCNAGAAYVYRFVQDTWVEAAKLTASDAGAGVQFGCDVAISGNVIVVGAPFDDEPCAPDAPSCLTGSAYVFRYDGDEWVEEAKVFSELNAWWEGVGCKVDIDGDVIALGAPQGCGIGSGEQFCTSGVGYLFRYDGMNWLPEARIKPDNPELDARFGIAVAVHGDLVVVGADRASGGGANSGAAYVFSHDGIGWTQEAILATPTPTGEEGFGLTVATDGARVLVGAPLDDEAAPGNPGLATGAVHVMAKDAGVWSLQQTLAPADIGPGDGFGVAIDMAGGDLVISAPFQPTAPANIAESGAAYLYRLEDGSWTQAAKFVPALPMPVERVGVDLAVSHGRVLLAAAGGEAMPFTAPYVVQHLGDCNDNDVVDACEVTTQMVNDVNFDGVPDACQPGACCVDGACSIVDGPADCPQFVCDVMTNVLPDCGGMCGTTCAGDANGDGVVTQFDRGFISANLGQTDFALLCQYDLNGDGTISIEDRGMVSANVGQCNPLPSWQDGSGLLDGGYDTRFGGYQGPFTDCESAMCP